MGCQTRRILFDSDIALVSDFCCRHPLDRFGYKEESEGDNLLLVRSGVFGRVIGKRRELADSAHVLFFTKGYSYRFFHPMGIGDTCTIITPTSEFLFETFGNTVRSQDPQRFSFHLPPMLVSPRAALLHGELLATIRTSAPLLSVEETLTELLVDMCHTAWGRTRPLAYNDPPSRRHDLAEETKILLNRRLETRPTLSELAKALDC